MVSIIGTIIAYAVGYLTARVKNKLSRVAHFFTIASLAIPGIVLGLSYTICFKGTFIYNTFIILILVNIVHFIASPYLMAYNALQKINPNYEVVAKTCNIPTYRIIFNVIVPCTKKTIREMFAYFFVNSMTTISAVAFLFNTKTMPLSLLINTYEEDLFLGEAAIISLIILLCNIVVKVIVYILNKRDEKKEMVIENDL
jgi:iron(III) transport system permease protein